MKYNLINFFEIDKYAVESYTAIHNINKSKNLGDITKVDIDKLPYCDMIVHGSPCQSFSVAGRGHGADEGTGTRSSLMWNSIEIIKHCKPKFVIWENVKNVLSPKHKHNFDKYLDRLEELGYKNYYQVLNAKNYKIPQNRERIFVISIRKDIDCGFEFPQKQELEIRLKHLLDDVVDEKYYISCDKIEKIQNSNFTQEKTRIQDPNSVCQTLLARDFKDPKCVHVCNLNDEKHSKMHDISKRVYSEDGLSPTIHTMGGGNCEPKVFRKDIINSIRVGGRGSIDRHQWDIVESKNGEIRKLTPIEYWRLMSFSDDDFNKAMNSLIKNIYNGKDRANSQLYKQAGNSIVVNVLSYIYKQLRLYYPNHFKDLDLISLFTGIGAFEKAFEIMEEI